ncbi:MAG: GNAT family N-acetyltransferase [Pyrinomonadaceae bacterium]|nr:GNAT family N-acetyltransferase [Pyrinomonadaceae bacterium]MCX7639971.1 GNAT family N-acetyltransferase [Pyrinomonadaceae bacterium]MDW8304143.1 N-acetyltransferase family protein [Acidobacteriota bacterium]
MHIRPVNVQSDVQKITEIYNYYVENSPQTFETEPISTNEMARRIDEIISENYPFLVAEDKEEILAYAYSKRFLLDRAFEYTASVAIYVKADKTHKGIGTALYLQLFDELAKTDFHTLIAAISLPNETAVRFHEKLGFKKVAHFYEVGYKLGRWIDVGYWQKMNIISDE